MLNFLVNNQILILFASGIFSFAIVLYSITIEFPSKEKKKSLVLVEISTALLMIFDAYSYLYRGNTTNFGYYMVRISNCIVFLMVISDFYFFNEYVKVLFKGLPIFNKSPLILNIVSYILLIGFALILISQFTGWVYYFDSNNIYIRGNLYPLSFICPFISAFVILVYLILYREYFEVRIVISTLLFIVLPLFAALIQLHVYGLSIINFAIFLAANFFFYSSLIDLNKELLTSATTDYITKLPNMSGFVLFLKRLRDKKILINYNAYYFELSNIAEYVTKFGSKYENNIVCTYSNHIVKFIDKDEMIATNTSFGFLALIKKKNTDKIISLLNNLECEVNIKHSIKKLNLKADAVAYSFDNNDMNIGRLMEIFKITQEYAKTKNIQTCLFMDNQLNKEIEEKQRLLFDIGLALTNKQFEPFYQAKVNNENNTICGAEALVRWKRNNEYISPYRFIPTMEKDGTVCDLDLLMLEKVCKNLNEWKNENKKLVPVSINFSRSHLSNPYIAETINEIVTKQNVPKELIQIEVTETIDEYSLDTLNEFVDKLHSFGFKVAIDDFGTGSSTLDLLNRIEFDCLKIDKSFVDNLEGRHLKILESIINLTKSLDIDTVVEGVETSEQNDFLKKIGCNVIQGYYFAKPEPVDLFTKRLN